MASSNLVDIHRCFKLKPSRLSVVFQCLVLGLIMLTLYQTLTMLGLVLSMLLLSLTYVFFLRQDQIQQLEQLNATEWTLCFKQSGQIQRITIDHMLDHHFYVVVYFQSKQLRPLIVWRDQLTEVSWKSLKTQVKFA